jgi:very-short-patch-repair endonuclease
MGEILFGYGYDRPNKTYSPAEEQFQETWLQVATPITLFREFKQDVRTVSSVCQFRYIDFAHRETRTAIELDGKDHLERAEDDQQREWELQQLGWNVIRFTNKEVWDDPYGCVLTTLEHIHALQNMTPTGVSAYQPQPFVPRQTPTWQQHRPSRTQRQQFIPQPEHPALRPRTLAFWWAVFSGIIAGMLAALSLPLGLLPTGLLFSLIAFLAGALTSKVTPRIWAAVLSGLFTGMTYVALLSFTAYFHFAVIPLVIAPLLAFFGARLARRREK